MTDGGRHRGSIGVVFAILLVDMLGFGIVIPVLPGLIMHLAKVPIGVAVQYAGWLGAGYAAVQFVFAPIIGNLSDRFGRRPVLLAAVLAMGIDYLIQASAPALWWLVIGRLVAGMTGASYTAAYACVADISPPEKRAANFGLMGMAFGFGFVVGPALGGILGGMGERLPFLAAAGLAIANFAVGFFVLKETLGPENRRPFDWRRANALAALRALRGQNATVLWFVAALAAWQLSHIVYPAVWSYFAIAAYGFTVQGVGIALAMVGFSSALVQGVGLRLLLPRLGERHAVMLGVGGLVAAAVLYSFAHAPWQVYVAIAVGSLQGFVQPSISALNSRAVDARSQGELQGAVQSIGAIAAIVGPPMYAETLARFSGGPGSIAHFPGTVMLLSAAISLVALVLFLTGARRMGGTQAREPAGQLSSGTSQ